MLLLGLMSHLSSSIKTTGYDFNKSTLLKKKPQFWLQSPSIFFLAALGLLKIKIKDSRVQVHALYEHYEMQEYNLQCDSKNVKSSCLHFISEKCILSENFFLLHFSSAFSSIYIYYICMQRVNDIII